MDRAGAIEKLRFLLYRSNLQENDLRRIREHDLGIQWLGK
jgi:hypothetical protein